MKIAVLICTYGGKDWADLAWSRAYPSVTEQGPGYEVVVAHYATGNLADARNVSVGRVHDADWLCFLDADDELAPGYLLAMRETMLGLEERVIPAGPKWASPYLLTPAVEYRYEGMDMVKPAALPNRHQPMSVMNHCVIGTLVHRNLFLAVGGFRRDLADCLLEDWAMWLACIRAGAEIVDVPAAVYRAHERPSTERRNQDCYPQLRAEHEAWMREQSSGGDGNREHLSSAEAAAVPASEGEGWKTYAQS